MSGCDSLLFVLSPKSDPISISKMIKLNKIEQKIEYKRPDAHAQFSWPHCHFVDNLTKKTKRFMKDLNKNVMYGNVC